MQIIVSGAQGYEEEILRMRLEVMENINMDPSGPGVQPLDYGCYVMTLQEGRPVAMCEYYFYDQRFDNFHNSIYAEAADLSNYGTVHDIIHLRTYYIDKQHRAVGRLYALNGLATGVVVLSRPIF